MTKKFRKFGKYIVKNIISNVSKILLTTYGSCGDVVRNVTTIAAPINDFIHNTLIDLKFVYLFYLT